MICPVCGRIVRVEEGIADFGDALPSDGQTALTAEALEAFFGLSGPGGYLALAGGVTSLADELIALIPGVRLVLVNPSADRPDSDQASVLRATRLPLKTGSLRGIAVGADLAADPAWVAHAAHALLPGLRMVAEGPAWAPLASRGISSIFCLRTLRSARATDMPWAQFPQLHWEAQASLSSPGRISR